ncbi:MAG TPA: thioredoxin family protein [Anaerolineales bacterium]|nr:thioredoxin family protein [Anaerolineales bacterium]
MDILIRLALTIALVLGGVALTLLYKWLISLRTPGLFADLGSVRTGVYTLVYFTTPTCAPCKTVQRPAIEKVRAHLGEQLQVLEFDATEHTALASRWGVMSVPTTFVLDPRGQLLHVNHGVTRAEKLIEQLKLAKG